MANPDQFGANVQWNPGYGPSGGTSAPSPAVPPAMAESIARSQGTTTLPNPTNVTPQQLANPVPSANSTPIETPTPANGQQAFQLAKQSGQAPPTTAGEAATAVKGFTDTAAAVPTFYKPDLNNPTLTDSKGKPISYDEYKALGGKGVMGQSNWTDVQNGAAPTAPATPIQGIEAQLSQDKGYQQLLKDYADYNSITEKSKSLVDTYNEIVKSSGLEAINTEMINMKNVIDGTEEDIRNEVQAASGFASDSQVLALSQARNKTLIKSYNKLVDQQSNITNQVNTMVGLASQDRQFALQSIQQKLQIDQQINDYRDKFVSNAQEGYNNVIKAVGYGGLVESLAHDPSSIAMVEKTLGVPSGTLAVAAQHEAQQAAQDEQARQLDLQYKQAQIGNIKSEIANRGASLALEKAKFAASQAATQNAQIATPMQLAQSQEKINLANTIINDKALNSAVGTNPLARGQINLPFGIKIPTSTKTVSGARTNFIASVEQLRSQLNLNALINAKAQGATFGALSDQELQVLSSSATKLGTWAIKDKSGQVTGYNAKEGDFKAELDKINNFAKLDYLLKGGTAGDVGVEVHPDGSAWTTNSNGTVTRIYP